MMVTILNKFCNRAKVQPLIEIETRYYQRWPRRAAHTPEMPDRFRTGQVIILMLTVVLGLPAFVASPSAVAADYQACGKDMFCRTTDTAKTGSTSAKSDSDKDSATSKKGSKKIDDKGAETFIHLGYKDGEKCSGRYGGRRQSKGSCGEEKAWSGEVIVELKGGARFKGFVKENQFSGQGEIELPSGARYQGVFKADRYNGQGIYTWPDKSTYMGKFEDGQRHGQGSYQWPEGADNKSYSGGWKDDKIDGRGTMVNKDGSKYVGQFKSGKYHGQGRYRWKNGSEHKGGYKEGKIHGQGTYKYYTDDGALTGTYVGRFVDGKRHGKGGQFTWSDKSYFKGEFKVHAPWNGDLRSPDGELIGKYIEGKKHTADKKK